MSISSEKEVTTISPNQFSIPHQAPPPLHPINIYIYILNIFIGPNMVGINSEESNKNDIQPNWYF